LILAGVTGGMVLAGAAPAAAQAAAPPGAQLPCAAVLTADEVKAAVGVALEALGARDRGAGETECPWMARGGPGGLKTVAVTFYDEHAIAASPTAPNGDAFFEMLVKAAEASNAATRDPIPGVGRRAAFVATSPQTLAVVHRANGVARIVANGLTKAQTIAIAKAVATP
jgi:hypothetical protein